MPKTGPEMFQLAVMPKLAGLRAPPLYQYKLLIQLDIISLYVLYPPLIGNITLVIRTLASVILATDSQIVGRRFKSISTHQ